MATGRGRRMARAAVVALVAVALALAVLWTQQRRLVYFPERSTPAPPAGVRPVPLVTSDGLRLTAWLVRPAARDRRVGVLVAPGNGGNRAGRVVLARALAGQGFTVLLLDYRGYGGNPGSPTEAGLARDVRAGWAHLVDAEGFPPARVLLLGESLGAAVAAELAADRCGAGQPPGGLLLRSPFTSLAAAGAEHYPWLPVSLLLRDRFEAARHVGAVPAPTAVVYGTADGVVPPGQSRAVAERAANLVAVRAVDGADHNDPALADGPAVVAAAVALGDALDR
ncbi:MAG TPA: alpha/beta fold hydrolase [Pilimelia sp.]|nr:alpha/beta fold hydrolase [Pilimelia sp.]